MPTRRFIRSAAVSVALVLGVGISSAQDPAPAQMNDDAQPVAPQTPMPLFADARNLALPQAGDARATPVLPILVDQAALRRSGIGRQFVLDLEPGVSFVATVDRIGRPGERCRTLGGGVQGTLDGTFAFAVYDDTVAMVVRVPSEQRLYRLQFMGGGAYWVQSINEALLPSCGGGIAAPAKPPRILKPDDDDDLLRGAEREDEETSGGGCGASTPVLDTMIVYTTAARTNAGGHAAIRAEAALAIDQTNVAYANSLIAARARLVYCSEVDYAESGSTHTDLERLRLTDDGFMDEIHDIRNSVNADLVALFLLNTDFLGTGHCSSSYASAFSVSQYIAATADFVHAHETGHNLGCAHDRYHADECGEDYNYGWRFMASAVQYRTVMAYAPGIRIAYFSNPNVSFLGTATGVADSEDNARVINARDTTIETFERTRYDIYVNFSFAGQELGTAFNPYNTLLEGVNSIDTPSTGAAEFPSLYVSTGTTTWTGTISKAMTILPCGGAVTIGQ